jgi:hypothetical protein
MGAKISIVKSCFNFNDFGMGAPFGSGHTTKHQKWCASGFSLLKKDFNNSLGLFGCGSEC